MSRHGRVPGWFGRQAMEHESEMISDRFIRIVNLFCHWNEIPR